MVTNCRPRIFLFLFSLSSHLEPPSSFVKIIFITAIVAFIKFYLKEKERKNILRLKASGCLKTAGLKYTSPLCVCPWTELERDSLLASSR